MNNSISSKIIVLIVAGILIAGFLHKSFAAQVVCIGLKSTREGISDIGDIIAVHDDDVELTGAGYALFEIYQIKGITKAELQLQLDLARVETKHQYDADLGETITCWLNEDSNPARWYKVIIDPKYDFTVEDFTIEDIATLTDEMASTDTKWTILSKIKGKIPLYPQNTEERIP